MNASGVAPRKMIGLVPSLSFALAFAFLCFQTAPSPFWLNSGGIIATAFGLGLAETPGSPGFALLGKFFSLLPLGSVAFRVNLLSTAAGALAITLLSRHFRRLELRTHPQPLLGEIVGPFAVAALALIGCLSFWVFSATAETHMLNLLLALFLLFVALYYPPNAHGWAVLAWLAGLCFAQQLLPGVFSVWALGLFARRVFREKSGIAWLRLSVIMTLMGGLGLASSFALNIRGGVFSLADGGRSQIPAFNTVRLGAALRDYSAMFLEQWGAWPLLLSILGLLLLSRKHARVVLGFLGLALLDSLYAVWINPGATPNLQNGLVTHAVVALGLGVGLWGVFGEGLAFLEARLPFKLFSINLYLLATSWSLLTVMFLTYLLVNQLPDKNTGEFWRMADLQRETLALQPAGAVYLSGDGNSHQATQYLQNVERFREDIFHRRGEPARVETVFEVGKDWPYADRVSRRKWRLGGDEAVKKHLQKAAGLKPESVANH